MKTVVQHELDMRETAMSKSHCESHLFLLIQLNTLSNVLVLPGTASRYKDTEKIIYMKRRCLVA